jgi:hypothetical protein
MTEIDNLAMERIEHLCVRAAVLSKERRTRDGELLLREAKTLSRHMDNDGELFLMRYHRYLSDSFGVTFEIDHGDLELMFGGV